MFLRVLAVGCSTPPTHEGDFFAQHEIKGNSDSIPTLLEARVLMERWRRHYNTNRPHSSLGWRPPTPDAIELKPMELSA